MGSSGSKKLRVVACDGGVASEAGSTGARVSEMVLPATRPSKRKTLKLRAVRKAIRAMGLVDDQQSAMLVRWWEALGLPTSPVQNFELSLDGDFSAVEFAVEVSEEQALAALPALIALLPAVEPNDVTWALSGDTPGNLDDVEEEAEMTTVMAETPEGGPRPQAQMEKQLGDMSSETVEEGNNILANLLDESLEARDVTRARCDTLRRISARWRPARAAVWLRFGGLDLQEERDHLMDLGLRFLEPEIELDLRTVVSDRTGCLVSLEEAAISKESGWALREVGVSLTLNGPETLIAARADEVSDEVLGEVLLSRVASAACGGAVREIARRTGRPVTVRAVQRDLTCDVRLALFFDLSVDLATIITVDLALGPSKVFDPLHVERLRQVFSDINGELSLVRIGFEADGATVLVLNVSSLQ